MSLRKITQDAAHATYAWVPMQAFDREWTDEALFAKYGVDQAEQAFITTQVRALNLDGNADE